MLKLTSIIILTSNQLTFTKICLNSLRKYTAPPYELIMIDNGSTDGTLPFLRACKPEVLIQNRENLGFSKGVNQGIRAARGEYLLLLNNDTVLSKGWLTNLLACLESDPLIGIAGPRTNYAGGSQGGVECAGRSLEKIHDFSRRFNQPDPSRWYETELIVGFCMLIRRKVVEEVGFFDERFRYGMFEDNDFCRRVREAGYKIYCAGDTFVYHYGSRSFLVGELNMARLFEINRRLYNEKWQQEGEDKG